MQRLLAIESSCDETAACVMGMDGRVYSNIIASQIQTHALYGGVVPEIASRQHVEALPAVVAQAVEQAGCTLQEIDYFACTYGPGLSGALLCGVNYAKGLSYALGKPLLGVNHMEGHLMANHVSYPQLTPPYVCLLASGGHTMLLYVERFGQYHLLGETRDDAAGEAFDKAARALGLAYPGGPMIEKLAAEGDPKAYPFTRPRCENPLDFSFSGLKTAVINTLHRAEQRGERVKKADMAASFQAAAIDFLLTNAIQACKMLGVHTLSMAGGVCANGALRTEAQQRCNADNIVVYLPEKGFCTDNAVMIAEAARRRLAQGERSDGTLNADPSLTLPYWRKTIEKQM